MRRRVPKIRGGGTRAQSGGHHIKCPAGYRWDYTTRQCVLAITSPDPCPHTCFNWNLSMELSCREATWYDGQAVIEFGVCDIWWEGNPDACNEPCDPTNIGFGDCHLDCNYNAHDPFGWGDSCHNMCIEHPHTGHMCCAHMIANGDY